MLPACLRAGPRPSPGGGDLFQVALQMDCWRGEAALRNSRRGKPSYARAKRAAEGEGRRGSFLEKPPSVLPCRTGGPRLRARSRSRFGLPHPRATERFASGCACPPAPKRLRRFGRGGRPRRGNVGNLPYRHVTNVLLLRVIGRDAAPLVCPLAPCCVRRPFCRGGEVNYLDSPTPPTRLPSATSWSHRAYARCTYRTPTRADGTFDGSV